MTASIFFISETSRDLSPALSTGWRVFSENCAGPSSHGFATCRAVGLAKAEARHAPRLVLDNIGGAQGQAEWFVSSEDSMYTTNIAKPPPDLPIARIRNTRDLFALVPREIHHLLLVVDPSDQSEAVLTIALEIAEYWGPQITLVCGARLFGWGASEQQSSETALIDLLCLSWQVKGVYPDVSISQRLPTSVAEVLDEAAERNVDLIMLPEPLAARFTHPELMIADGGLGAACPIIIVADPESDWLRRHT
jgi:hypothetical protein